MDPSRDDGLSPLGSKRFRRAAIMVVDALAAALPTVMVGGVIGTGRLARRRTPPAGRELLVLDAAYSLASIRTRELEGAVTARDLEGWFDHVWSVHPYVGADPVDDDHAAGGVITTELAPRHTLLEGHVGRSTSLTHLPIANFVVAQLSLARRLVALLRTRPIVAIRVGDPYYQGMLGLALARSFGIPLVVRINGNDDAMFAALGRPALPRLFRRRSIEKAVARFVLARADLVVAGNEDNLGYAVANGARDDRTAVFSYGNLLHPAHFGEPDERRRVASALGLAGRPLLVCISRLEPVKFVDDLLNVTLDLRSTHPAVAMVLVGDGSLRGTLTARRAAVGLDDSFVLAGNRDQTWIASILAEATVIVAPMMGRALVEAALSGRPIVAYDVDWHRELVRDGQTGMLVACRDATAMASAVRRFLDDPEAATRVGDAARTDALVRMSPHTLNQLERETYELMMADFHASRAASR